MTAPIACCHDNFQWYDLAPKCPSCQITHNTWRRLAERRTDTLIDYLNGNIMSNSAIALPPDAFTIELAPLPTKLVDAPKSRPIPPTRAHVHDAGLDLYASVTRYIEHGTITAIPLGVAVAIPPGYVGLLTLRSSLGREGLVIPNAPGIIDAGYRGELLAQLTMIADDSYRIEAGDRIAQMTIVSCITPAVELVDILPESSDGRGDGGFGSSGR